MNKIRVLIIDDEQLARQVISNYLETLDGVEIIGECFDGFDGFKKINELKPDLVFLDVMMPKLTGFEMLELVEEPPIVIFSTAYDDYAIKAFEQNAADYLLKPYAKERFMDAFEKAKQKLVSKTNETQQIRALVIDGQENEEVLSRIVVRNGNKIHILSLDKILYLEAQDDYVKLHTVDGSFLKQNTMKYYEKHLPANDFHRIHRSYIARIKEISRLELMGKDSYVVILRNGTQLAVSRSGYTGLKTKLDF